MKKLIVAVLAVCAGMSAFAANDLLWCGPDGGLWNDAGNWEWIDHPGLHQVPTATNGVWFSMSMTKPCTVVIDGECVANQVAMSNSQDKTRTADDTLGDVTLSGTGSLTVQSAFEALRGRALIIDGPTVKAPRFSPQDGRIVVRSGALNATEVIRASGGVTNYFIVEGGTVTAKGLEMVHDSLLMTFIHTGGTVTVAKGGLTLSKARPDTFQQKGGTFSCGDSSGNLSIDDRANGNTTHAYHDQVFEFGGEFMVTNVAASRFFFCGDNLTITGGGNLYSCELWCTQPSCAATVPDKLTLDVGGLYLSRYILAATGYKHDLNFPRKVTLGTFAHPGGGSATGDWNVSDGSSRLTFTFEKGIVFDTTDCFDKETPHTIAMSQAKLGENAELDVVGNGTASLKLLSGKARLSKLTVGAGATYALSGNLRAGKLVMEEGSTIKITVTSANSLEIDDWGASSVDPTARFVVTVPTGLTSATVPIVFAAVKELPILDRFEIEGDDRGYRLARVGGCICITKKAYSGSTATWRGATDEKVSTVTNWDNEKIPYGNTAPVNLDNQSRPVISNDYTSTQGSVWNVVRFNWPGSGPFEIKGEALKVNGTAYVHANANFYNTSAAPMYVNADVSPVSSSLAAVNLKESYVFFGANVTASSALHVTGDARVGGVLSCAEIQLHEGEIDRSVLANHLSARLRPSTLTVCRGGVATVSKQDFAQYVGAYRVDAGGKLTVTKGVWEWSHRHLTPKDPDVDKNTFEVVAPTNVIDGTLELGATFAGEVPVCFDGNGTVKLTGDALTTESAQKAVVIGDLTLDLGDSGELMAKWDVAEGASLKLATTAQVLTLKDSCDGTLDLPAGVKIAVGGDLAAAIDAAGRSWTKVARVPDGAAVPQVQGAYQVRINDGVLEIRNQFGALLIVR